MVLEDLTVGEWLLNVTNELHVLHAYLDEQLKTCQTQTIALQSVLNYVGFKTSCNIKSSQL